MAENKRGRIAAGARPAGDRSIFPGDKKSQQLIDLQWTTIPAEAKHFILKNPNGSFDLSSLINFWSKPQNIPYTRGDVGATVSAALWYLALIYQRIGLGKEARSLAINGAFIHECYQNSIEYITSASRSGGIVQKLKFFSRGVNSIHSKEAMESYIQTFLPPDHRKQMTVFANLSEQNNVLAYIDDISDEWNGTSSAPKKGRSRRSSTVNETQIKLIFANGSEAASRHSFEIGSSITLKALFNEYADKRGISLRSLRFSYMGKTLFLSNAGRKTPEELGLQDRDVIVVHDTSISQQPVDDEGDRSQTSDFANSKAKKRSNKKSEGNVKSKERQSHGKAVVTREECRNQHSRQLTRIHEEAQDQFKLIRQRLNNLAIERSHPKVKTKRTRSPRKKTSHPSPIINHFEEDTCRKAGRSRYEVQVGEVKNLHKSTKPSAIASRTTSPIALSTLDLHGCTREEALAKLDGALEVWVDTAMRGPYPFVQPVSIVCGYGSQILSETVQEWIRSNDKVSNAPKLRSSKR